MNCGDFEQKIALYVEGDLPSRDAARVEEHLAACSACRLFADELQESQASLKSFGAFEIDDAALDNLRRSVMGQVSVRRNGSSFWSRLFNLRNWRFATASLLACALLFSVLFYLLRPPRTEQQAVRHDNPKKTFIPKEGPVEERVVAHKRTKRSIKPKPASDNSGVINLPRSLETGGMVMAGMSRNEVLEEKVDEIGIDLAPVEENKIRMELQTGDPKVRIIWFFDKEPERSRS